MTVNTTAESSTMADRVADTNKLADGEAIQDGREHGVGNVEAVTLFLKVMDAVAVDVIVELSPDSGSTWYQPDESPVSFASDDEDAVEHIPYNADRIRLTSSNDTPVTAQLREVV